MGVSKFTCRSELFSINLVNILKRKNSLHQETKSQIYAPSWRFRHRHIHIKTKHSKNNSPSLSEILTISQTGIKEPWSIVWDLKEHKRIKRIGKSPITCPGRKLCFSSCCVISSISITGLDWEKRDNVFQSYEFLDYSTRLSRSPEFSSWHSAGIYSSILKPCLRSFQPVLHSTGI